MLSEKRVELDGSELDWSTCMSNSDGGCLCKCLISGFSKGKQQRNRYECFNYNGVVDMVIMEKNSTS